MKYTLATPALQRHDTSPAALPALPPTLMGRQHDTRTLFYTILRICDGTVPPSVASCRGGRGGAALAWPPVWDGQQGFRGALGGGVPLACVMK